MTTSGTVGQTIISTAKVIEHALRRAGVLASAQTPEIVDIAKECLFLLLTHYSNTSFNLWCVERKVIGYEPGRKEYLLPSQTNDVLNVLHGTPTLASILSLASNVATLESVQSVTRVGIKFSVLPTADYTVSVSSNGTDFYVGATGKSSNTVDVDSVYWFDFDPLATCLSLSVSGGTVEAVYAATSVSEIPITPLNRDQYAELPNKDTPSSTVVNYLFNKTLNPSLFVWPVPSDKTRHMVVWVHRQIQDVGGLTQTLAIPSRWFESTIIQLAFRLSMELPGVDPARIKMLSELSQTFAIEVENEETDSAPSYVRPGISPYTR